MVDHGVVEKSADINGCEQTADALSKQMFEGDEIETWYVSFPNTSIKSSVHDPNPGYPPTESTPPPTTSPPLPSSPFSQQPKP
jgi:hypothetical protein